MIFLKYNTKPKKYFTLSAKPIVPAKPPVPAARYLKITFFSLVFFSMFLIFTLIPMHEFCVMSHCGEKKYK